jgi:hypothetical protein
MLNVFLYLDPDIIVLPANDCISKEKDCFLRLLEVELQRTGSRKSSTFDLETTENSEARQANHISPESKSAHASSRACMPTR